MRSLYCGLRAKNSNRPIKIGCFHLSLENSLSGIIAAQNIVPVPLDFTITCNYFKPPLLFRQSFSFRPVFASLNFPLAYCFYVVFRTLLPFIFFSSVFEAFDWPHSVSPEQLPWEISLQNLDRLLSPRHSIKPWLDWSPVLVLYYAFHHSHFP